MRYGSWSILYSFLLSPVHSDAENGNCRRMSPISATIVASVDRLFLLFVNYLFGNVCVSIVLLTQQGLYFEPRPDPAHA